MNKAEPFIYIKKSRFKLTPPQHAFLATFLETAVENDNQPQRDRDITAQVSAKLNAGVFERFGGNGGADRLDHRMLHVMRSEEGWKAIVERVGRGSYRVTPKFMFPTPEEIPFKDK